MQIPALLAETLAECDNVKIIEGDVLKTDLAALICRGISGPESGSVRQFAVLHYKPYRDEAARGAFANRAYHGDGAKGSCRPFVSAAARAWPVRLPMQCIIMLHRKRYCFPCSRAAFIRRLRSQAPSFSSACIKMHR